MDTDNIHILAYLAVIDSFVMDSEVVNNLKSSKVYQHFYGNEAGHVLLKEVGHNLVFLEADIEPVFNSCFGYMFKTLATN